MDLERATTKSWVGSYLLLPPPLQYMGPVHHMGPVYLFVYRTRAYITMGPLIVITYNSHAGLPTLWAVFLEDCITHVVGKSPTL